MKAQGQARHLQQAEPPTHRPLVSALFTSHRYPPFLSTAIHLSFPHSPSLEKKEKFHRFHVGEWSCRSPLGEVGGCLRELQLEVNVTALQVGRGGRGLGSSAPWQAVTLGQALLVRAQALPRQQPRRGSRDVIIVAISCFHRGGDEGRVNRPPRNAAWICFTAAGPVARGGHGWWNLWGQLSSRNPESQIVKSRKWAVPNLHVC